jgi:hypothetical protein
VQFGWICYSYWILSPRGDSSISRSGHFALVMFKLSLVIVGYYILSVVIADLRSPWNMRRTYRWFYIGYCAKLDVWQILRVRAIIMGSVLCYVRWSLLATGKRQLRETLCKPAPLMIYIIHLSIHTIMPRGIHSPGYNPSRAPAYSLLLVGVANCASVTPLPMAAVDETPPVTVISSWSMSSAPDH